MNVSLATLISGRNVRVVDWIKVTGWEIDFFSSIIYGQGQLLCIKHTQYILKKYLLENNLQDLLKGTGINLKAYNGINQCIWICVYLF